MNAPAFRADSGIPGSGIFGSEPDSNAGIYRYDDLDRRFVAERVEQFSNQVARRLAGELSEDEFKPLRLMNGLYLQLHAYMLRIAVPYGVLTTTQFRKLSEIGRKYDKGYGHFTTRQNIQFNWIKLEDTPAILGELAEVDMHALQTSGNCVRNVTTDQFVGASADEIVDGRVYAEILRQWTTRTRNSLICRASSRSRSWGPTTTAPRSAPTISA